ncbi:hypothetical protein KIN20_010007, partial [Parelaphostrongylus tenuis]
MEVEDSSNGYQSAMKDGAVTLDSTMEYCRNIGDIPTYGLAGNRTDAIDVSDMKGEIDEADENAIKNGSSRRLKGRHDVRSVKESKIAREAKRTAEYSDDDDDDSLDAVNGRNEYENVLGKEADVSKGVGAMLKLAAQKGYLNDNEVKKKNRSESGSSSESVKDSGGAREI